MNFLECDNTLQCKLHIFSKHLYNLLNMKIYLSNCEIKRGLIGLEQLQEHFLQLPIYYESNCK